MNPGGPNAEGASSGISRVPVSGSAPYRQPWVYSPFGEHPQGSGFLCLPSGEPQGLRRIPGHPGHCAATCPAPFFLPMSTHAIPPAGTPSPLIFASTHLLLLGELMCCLLQETVLVTLAQRKALSVPGPFPSVENKCLHVYGLCPQLIPGGRQGPHPVLLPLPGFLQLVLGSTGNKCLDFCCGSGALVSGF